MAKGESKSYNPSEHERRIFAQWEAGGFFHPEPDERPREQRFSMVIPPPNVTGALHLGHALNNTLQDILVRRKRMEGRNAFWLVGTDHAGIATQATVEKSIRKDEGKSRHDLGREELVRRIWEWKEKFGGRIVEQLKLMGCSCDYERERFTLDEGCAKAVRETFFKMFRDGLIYRGKRLVNWDTQLQTAVADDEVYHEQVKGHFYYFRYPILRADESNQPDAQAKAVQRAAGESAKLGADYLLIATTRPETMLGDTAVAVHPEPDAALEVAETQLQVRLREASEKERPAIQAQLEDIADRKMNLLPTLLALRDMAKAGRKVLLPLVNREIPLICDEWADPSLGTGCVKITPAHDMNDYEVGQRNALPMLNMLTPDGRVNENGGPYKGLKLAEARKKIVEDLEQLGLVEKIEDRLIELAHSDRSNTPIEPYLSDQWFVKMGDLEPEHAAKVEGLRGSSGLAQMAIDAIQRGEFRFHPARYEKTYLDWLSEKRDWCISRQLWWGHRIPVWTHDGFTEDVRESESVNQQLIKWEAANRVASTSLAPIEGTRATITRREVIDLPASVPVSVCVSRDDDVEAVRFLESHGYEQDPDVLDTWFSSALWPHSTLGWPTDEDLGPGSWDLDSADTAQAPSPKPQSPGPKSQAPGLLDYYYPTNVLSTAREIITLWVARMVITGLYNVGEVPFRDVVIHPVIQDGQGRKMSKTLGNGVDPVDIIEEYGADALRYTLAELATETQDIRLPVKPKKLPDGRTINVSEKFEKGRNFCNKLWQASTGFVIPNLEGYASKPLDPATLGLVDRWILSRLTACIAQVNESLDRFRFSDAMGAAYRFMWDEYCSWYIEMTKPRLAGPERAAAQQVLVYVLDQLLRLLHPFIPFVTEAVWAELQSAAPARGLREIKDAEPLLVAANWPAADVSLRDEVVEKQMTELQDIIRSTRDIRTVVNEHRGRSKMPSIRQLPKVVIRADTADCKLIDGYKDFIRPLAGCELLEVGPDLPKPPGAMSRVCGAMQVYAPVGDLVDLAEVKRADSARLDELRGVLARETARLSNEDFVKRADPAIVDQAKARAADLSSQIQMLESSLSDMA